MSKFIDAYKFREMMDHEYPFDKYTQTHYPALDEAKSAVLKILDTCPAVEVEPVRHGQWEKVYGDHISMGLRPWVVCCSVCGRVGTESNYCPNCGARMRE